MREGLDRRLLAVMFTDMVGFTALMQADERLAIDRRARYVDSVERHHLAFGGTVVQRLGDGTLGMFPNSVDAVLAAVAMQQELAPQDVAIRIGIHVGDVIVEPEQLIGDAVNIASRIESFAVPGGVFLSDSAYDVIKNRPDIAVVGLGRFKLKNVGRPFELYAVSADGIVTPDPRMLEGKGERFASLPSNLPAPGSPLVGRASVIASLVEIVGQHRMVTITGPGGVGKTRILVELGHRLAPEFLDGIAFIELADIRDAAEVLPAIADALDVKEAEGRALRDGVVSLIAEKTALLLLDNFEQVVSAAPEVAGLVDACPNLRIVVTSRTPLRISSEVEFPLAPLALPSSAPESVEALTAYPAVALFLERAKTIRGPFVLTPETAHVIAAICRRLDGVPLALELAAARLRLLTPDQLLERLDHSLNLLTSGSRDTPERHQALRATIDWSYSLLTTSERRLFRQMAAFAGGCGIADVEAVCVEPGESGLDDLESLVDQALVQVDGHSGRLRMLETIAEYAREQLDGAEESAVISMRHAKRYASVAQEIRDGIEGTQQVDSVARAVAEEPNLQLALDTFLAAARNGDVASREDGLQMCGDLYLYWHIRGKHLTAREYAGAFLDVDVGSAPSRGRSAALVTEGLASWTLGHFERANQQWSESYKIAEEMGAQRELCLAGLHMGIGMLGVDPDDALRWANECVERSRSLGFTFSVGLASFTQGMVHAISGDFASAHARFSEALESQLRSDDNEGAGMSLGGLAQVASAQGELARALDLYGRSLHAFEAIGDRAEQARILDEMAWAHLKNDDSRTARHHFFAAVQAYTDVASVRGVGLCVIGLAAAEAAEGRTEIALKLAAAAEVFAHQEGIVNVYSDETPGREFIDRARAVLPAEVVERSTEAGRALTVVEALDLARLSTA